MVTPNTHGCTSLNKNLKHYKLSNCFTCLSKHNLEYPINFSNFTLVENFNLLQISTFYNLLEFQPFSNLTHRLTCPHTSHQNGTMQRKHIHIVEMRLTLLAHSFIPITYWDHSFSISTYQINRFPTPTLTKYHSPFHDLYGKHPDYNSLKVFGCSCSPLLRPYNKHKIQFQSQ